MPEHLGVTAYDDDIDFLLSVVGRDLAGSPDDPFRPTILNRNIAVLGPAELAKSPSKGSPPCAIG